MRLYPLIASNADTLPTVTRRGTWNVNTGAMATNRALTPTRGGASGAGPAAYKTTTSASGATARTTNPSDYGGTTHISAAFLSAGSISGSLTWCLNCYESSTALNTFTKLHAWVMTPTGAVRGTLVNNVIGTVEYPYSASGQAVGTTALSNSHAMTTVPAEIGDRLVLEMGFRFASGTVATNVYGQYLIGGTEEIDLTPGNVGQLQRVGWVDVDNVDALFAPPPAVVLDDLMLGSV